MWEVKEEEKNYGAEVKRRLGESKDQTERKMNNLAIQLAAPGPSLPPEEFCTSPCVCS